ncbi:MAG: hypothetical protein K9M08_08510 [Pirellula sp.]|nr:hypothetical protein [Pirellula sp.]
MRLNPACYPPEERDDIKALNQEFAAMTELFELIQELGEKDASFLAIQSAYFARQANFNRLLAKVEACRAIEEDVAKKEGK